MRITKEVTISADVNVTWTWLLNAYSIKSPGGSRDDKISVRNQPRPRRKKSGLKLYAFDPPNKLSFSGDNLNSSIVTTFDLNPRGKGTSLKVTVTGWDKIETEKARLEMPKVSFTLEKKLGEFKKAIEKSIKRQKSPVVASN